MQAGSHVNHQLNVIWLFSFSLLLSGLKLDRLSGLFSVFQKLISGSPLLTDCQSALENLSEVHHLSFNGAIQSCWRNYHPLCVPHLLSHLILVVLWSSWFYSLLQRRKLRLGEINLVKISHRVNGRNNIQAKFICLKTHALFTMSPCLSKWSKKITLCSLYTAICKAPPESIWNISVCVNNSSIT